MAEGRKGRMLRPANAHPRAMVRPAYAHPYATAHQPQLSNHGGKHAAIEF